MRFATVDRRLHRRLLRSARVAAVQVVAAERDSKARPVRKVNEAVLWQRLVREEAAKVGDDRGRVGREVDILGEGAVHASQKVSQ